MDFSTLQTFVAVAEQESFSKAAEHLHLTQPAVSKRIATLETELDIRLFDRIGRKITLTEAGRELLRSARRIILEIEDSLRALSNLSGRVAGRLSMGTSHHIGLHRLPPVLRAYVGRYPDVELDMRFMDSEVACRAVERGDLELAIVTLPTAAAPALETLLVWRDSLAIVVGEDHPLTQNEPLSPARLAEYPGVLPAVGTYTREILERACAPLGIALNVGLTTNYLETLKMLVSVGLGWSVLPRTMLDASMRALHCPELSLERQLGVAHHRERTLSNAAQAMIEACQRVAEM